MRGRGEVGLEEVKKGKRKRKEENERRDGTGVRKRKGKREGNHSDLEESSVHFSTYVLKILPGT